MKYLHPFRAQMNLPYSSSSSCPAATQPFPPDYGESDSVDAMITRHNLPEQLREYQKRSKLQFASASFFSLTSRVDIVIFVLWELTILAFLVFSAVSLYFRRMRLAFILVCITVILLLCMKVTARVRLARKKKRRMLLPLSM